MSYKWDAKSAFNKLSSGIQFTVSTPTPVVSISKSFDVTPPHNPKVDAYRNCAICGKHYNYHKDGKCP